MPCELQLGYSTVYTHAVFVLQVRVGVTCKVLGNTCVNGARAMWHGVVLGHLSEEGSVVASSPHQGQMTGLAGQPLRYPPI